MRNGSKYAVAVRDSKGRIEIQQDEYDGLFPGSVVYKIPFLRGVFSFVDSLVLGLRSLNYSADVFTREEDGEGVEAKEEVQAVEGQAGEAVQAVEGQAGEGGEKDSKGSSGESGFSTALIMIVAIMLSIGLFMVLPYYASLFFSRWIENPHLLALVEGAIRIVIFVSYILMISRVEETKRLFRYHGAEHKCINCLETGHELTVENVRAASRRHKRCGTSFLLYVMVISILLFAAIQVESRLMRGLLRIVLVPVIAGIAYELIRIAGRSSNPLIQALSAPGMAMQALTTAEPDDEMIRVGIASVEAVFDWRKYLKENFRK